jgi:hypothetical protein
MAKTAEEIAARDAKRAQKKEGRRGNKFTGSDAIALGTTAISTVGSLMNGLKYEPDADKPKVYNPIVTPAVGDPNYDRYINEIEKNKSTTSRKIRDNSGSDTNKGILGLLEADRQGLEAKNRVQTRHSDMLRTQTEKRDAILSEAERINVEGENRFRERKQDRDVRGAERAQDAAKGALESSGQYFVDKFAAQKSSEVLERQANDRIDIVRRQERTNFDATYLPLYGPEKTAALWEDRKEETDKFYEGKYGNVYGTRDAYLAEQAKLAKEEKLKNDSVGFSQKGVGTTTIANPIAESGNAELVDLTGKLGDIETKKTVVPGQETKSKFDVSAIKKFFNPTFKSGIGEASANVINQRGSGSPNYGTDANYPDEWTRETFDKNKADMDEVTIAEIEKSLVRRGL